MGLVTVAAVGLGSAAVATVGIPLAVSAAGFTAAGVAAGSFAAVTQAGIGNVVAGSAFAIAQSIGATGAIATPTAAIIGAGASAVYGIATSLFFR